MRRQLLVLLVLQLLVTVYNLATVTVVSNGDPSHYYCEARNLALGRGLTDSNLSIFLAPPSSVIRPAGDYWPCGWSVVLGGAMALAGTSPARALLVTALVSLLLPLATFLLARRLTGQGLLAGVLVCLQARLWLLEAIPDVTIPYLVLTTLGLALVSRPVLAGAVLGLPLWLRGDGFVGLLVALITQRQPRLLAGAALTIGPLLVYNVVCFGRPMPAPRGLVPFMAAHTDLYDPVADPSLQSFLAQGAGTIAGHVLEALKTTGVAALLQLPLGLWLVALVGMRQRRLLPATLFVLFSWLVPTTVAPMVAGAHRVVPHLVPCLCVLAAGALQGVSRRWVAVLLGLLCVVPGPWCFRDEFSRAAPAYVTDLQAHVRVGPEDVVLAEDSWMVGAYLDSASLQSPSSAEGLVALLERYHPRYMVGVRGRWLEMAAGLLEQGGYVRRKAVYTGPEAVLYEFDYQVVRN